jgi:hypothetical protein
LRTRKEILPGSPAGTERQRTEDTVRDAPAECVNSRMS